jgi:DeoR family transcriptional regulator, fructose operon transcriptional repressor
MFAAERHEHILRAAKSAGRVDVNELADALGVTTETIRRDLSHLQRRGVLRRVHGGAMPTGRLTLAPVGDDRTDSTAAAVRIAEAALEELPDRGSILLSTGEATARLAEMLPADRPLTVVTNALSVASTLVAHPGTTVVVVGGRVDRHTAASVGSWALHQISQSFVEVAFLEPSGISVRRGLSEPDLANAAIKAAMMASARRTIVLADHQRVGADALVRFGELKDVDAFVTDPGIDEQAAKAIAACGPRVLCV